MSAKISTDRVPASAAIDVREFPTLKNTIAALAPELLAKTGATGEKPPAQPQPATDELETARAPRPDKEVPASSVRPRAHSGRGMPAHLLRAELQRSGPPPITAAEELELTTRDPLENEFDLNEGLAQQGKAAGGYEALELDRSERPRSHEPLDRPEPAARHEALELDRPANTSAGELGLGAPKLDAPKERSASDQLMDELLRDGVVDAYSNAMADLARANGSRNFARKEDLWHERYRFDARGRQDADELEERQSRESADKAAAERADEERRAQEAASMRDAAARMEADRRRADDEYQRRLAEERNRR